MIRDEVVVILGTLKTAYPKFYMNMTKEEMHNTIDLWCEMFKHDDPVIVTASVKQLITSFKFPPTIADVKEAMYKLANNDTDNMELWNELDTAVRNCLYKEREVFESLSPIVKRFLGSPAQLRELALSDSATFSTVTKGQFLKQAEILKQREKDNTMMLPEIKQLFLNNNQKFLS